MTRHASLPASALVLGFLLLASSAPGAAADRSGPTPVDLLAAGRAALDRGDPPEARALWGEAAAAEDARAIFALGAFHERGLGGKPDPEAAVRHYRRAAALGFAPAQFNLGAAYLEGRGVRRDVDAALRYWRLAAAQEFPHAQFNLATMLLLGRGVPENPAQAREWYERAARNGHPAAQRLLRSGALRASSPPTAAGAEPAPAVGCLGSLEASAYVIQLAALGDREAVERYRRRHEPRGEIIDCRVRTAGRELIVLLVAGFGDIASAQAELPTQPAGAWIRRAGSLAAAVVP